MRTIRTNRVGARIFIKVTGTDHVGVVFGDSFRQNSVSGLTFVPGRVGYRVYLESSFPSTETYRFAPASGTLICADLLNTGSSYICEIFVEKLGTYQTPSGTEYIDVQRWRDSDSGVAGAYAAFVEVRSVIANPNATVSYPSATAPSLKVLIVGDRNVDGQLNTGRGYTRYLPFYGTVDGGVFKSYGYLAAQSVATQLNRVLTVRFASHPEASWLDLSGAFPWTIRAGLHPNFWTTLGPSGVSSNARITYRNEESYKNGIGINLDTGQTIQTGSNKKYAGWIRQHILNQAEGEESEFVPDIVLFCFGDNDLRWLNTVNSQWQTRYSGAIFNLIRDLSLDWPSTNFCVVSPFLRVYDSTVTSNPALIQSITESTVSELANLDIPVSHFNLLSLAGTPSTQALEPIGTVLNPEQSQYFGNKLADHIMSRLASVTLGTDAGKPVTSTIKLGARSWSCKSTPLFSVRLMNGQGYKATLVAGVATVTFTYGTTSGLSPGMFLTVVNGGGRFGADARILSIQSSTQLTLYSNHPIAGLVTFTAGIDTYPADYTVSSPVITPTSTTITAQGIGAYSPISVTLTINTVDKRIMYGGSVMNAAGSTWAVDSLLWPNLNIYPYASGDDCVGYVGDHSGSIINRPQDVGIRNLQIPNNLYSIPLAALYDKATKTVLATRSEDTEGHTKELTFGADTTSTKIQWRHLFYDRYKTAAAVGAAQEKVIPYQTVIEGWDSAAPHAFDVHADIAFWYRDWAVNSLRPFTNTGPWRSSPNLSPLVKNTVASLVLANPWNPSGVAAQFSNFVSDVTNLRSICGLNGTDDVLLVHLYPWAKTIYNTRMPDVFWDNRTSNNPGTLSTTITPEVVSGITTMEALGNVAVMPYTLTNVWDAKNDPAQGYTGAFNYYGYTPPAPLPNNTLNISTLVLKDLLGQAVGFLNPVIEVGYDTITTNLDFSQTNTKYAVAGAYLSYLNAFTGSARPKGWYYDVSPYGTTGLDRYFNDDPTRTWRIVDHAAGIKDTVNFVKELARTNPVPQAGLPSAFFGCEGASQHMIGTFDIQHVIAAGLPVEIALTGPNGNRYVGGSVFSYHFMFGEYVRLFNHSHPNIYALTGGAPLTTAQILTTTLPQILWHWLLSGVIQVVSRIPTGPTVPAVPSTGDNDIIWKWFGTVSQGTTRTVLKKYFMGRLLPCPGGTINQWLRDFQAQHDLPYDIWWGLYGIQYTPTISVCRQADDGHVAVIAVNSAHPSLDYTARTIISLPVVIPNFSATYTIELNTKFHRLPTGEKWVYRYNPATSDYTKIATFTDSITLTGVQPPIFSQGSFPASLHVITPAGETPS